MATADRLSQVRIAASVFRRCLQHATSTEGEEIMGLLLGDWADQAAVVSHVIPLSRSDRQPDRVEVSPEQLSLSLRAADELTKSTGRGVRVVGWFHSHPHITVLPSMVDLRTEAQYQQLDARFFGLIISVFNEGAGYTNRIRASCFQSAGCDAGGWEHVEVPVEIGGDDLGGAMTSDAQLLRLLFAEERERYTERLASATSTLERHYISNVYEQQLSRLMEYLVLPAVRVARKG